MKETEDSEEVEYPELPSGWEWRGGEDGESYYTINFGTTYKMGGPYAGEYGLGGFDGQIIWDEGGEHSIEIWPIESIDQNGDPRFGYPVACGFFDSKQEAVNSILDLIEGL